MYTTVYYNVFTHVLITLKLIAIFNECLRLILLPKYKYQTGDSISILSTHLF